MGFLDFLFGRKGKDEEAQAAPPKPQLTPWQERMQGWHGKTDDNEKFAICKEILEMVAPAFANAKVVVPEDGLSCELRGRVEDVPIRIALDPEAARIDGAEARIENRRGRLWLSRDYSKIPKKHDPDEDWDDDEEVRVFVAKGIYIEGYERDVETVFPIVEALGAEAKGWLTGEMERLSLKFVMAKESFTAEPDFSLDQHPDPVAYLGDLVQFLVQSAHFFASGDGGISAESQAPARGHGGDLAAALAPRVQCSYCDTVFLLDASSQCPNCAGPYKG